MPQASKPDRIWRDIFITLSASLGVGLAASLLLVLLVVLLSADALAASGAAPGNETARSRDTLGRGTLLLKLASGGVSRDAPLLRTEVEMDISGMLARVRVLQRFRNPGNAWVEGVYVFPLPEQAAVDRMRLRVGDRLIEGEIKEREEARKNYQQAKREGRRTSLLSQERPNVFTTSVANIAPGEEIQVELEYQQSLTYDQGRFSIRFPMVVAPRYIPGAPLGSEEVSGFQGSGWASNSIQVPDASRITPPVVDPAGPRINPVAIGINLNPGFELQDVISRYHPVDIERSVAGLYRITLQKGTTPGDRDFELTWVPRPGQAPAAALFHEDWQGTDYGLLMVMPPVAVLPDAARVPREMVLVIDTSGSMHGASIEQARAALKLALDRLAPGDSFNVIQFNQETHALFDKSVQASRSNVQRAIRYVSGLEAEGGTEMLPAISLALTGSSSEQRLRQVIFLTDGSVGNENELFSIIQRRLGDSRLFTVGIGSAPNSFFMTRAAKFGRGSFTYIGSITEVKQRMSELFVKLESPVLTDIAIDRTDMAGVDLLPNRLPDLYAGEPLVIAVRMGQRVPSFTITGTFAGQDWSQQISLSGGRKSPGVHVLWARRAIAQLMDRRAQGIPESEVRTAVLKLALSHQLVSRYTSLVAVDQTPVRPSSELLDSKSVPSNLPAGWSSSRVFGQLPQTATSAPMHLLLGLLTLVAGWLLRSLSASGPKPGIARR